MFFFLFVLVLKLLLALFYSPKKAVVLLDVSLNSYFTISQNANYIKISLKSDMTEKISCFD